MSTPSRGRGGGVVGGFGTTSGRGRGNTGRARGRGRAGSSAPPSSSTSGLLQKLRTGTVQRTGEDGSNTSSRGRGVNSRGQTSTPRRARGALSQALRSSPKPSPSTTDRIASSTPTSSYRDFMAHMTDKFQALKPRRDSERRKAIQDGILADPDKKTSLANAITPVGTCTEMCPEFERVERIVQNMVDKAEKVTNEAAGRDLPSEDRMIKRFRRSAAGYDEQLPSDIRTPETLRRTLDYLLDKVIGGGERLASIHKFVWDRTRGIRNDFSIQQVSKAQDVRVAIDCFERIARFHILSLHQLSNPDNLQEGEHFDAHQEREQLNNTLLSLMYYYDDNRHLTPLPNEAEFRSYCILFELQALTPDLEERMQSWPQALLNNHRVQTSFKVYAAAGNTIFDQGPLRPLVPFSIAQANPGRFWTLLASNEVSYMMACVAEMNFSMVRFTSLDALWRSAKSAPQNHQQRNQEWTLSGLAEYLGFDDEEQTLDFVQDFGLAFATSSAGEQYLDLTATAATVLDRSLMPSQQTFSREIVERKRYHRTLVAVINGISVATAIRHGLVVDPQGEEFDDAQAAPTTTSESIFIPEQSGGTLQQSSTPVGSFLNPQATQFTPASFASSSGSRQSSKPLFSTKFGDSTFSSSPQAGFGRSSPTPDNEPASSGFAPPQNIFNAGFQSTAISNQATNPFQRVATFQNNSNENASDVSSSFVLGKPNLAFTPETKATELNTSAPLLNLSNLAPTSLPLQSSNPVNPPVSKLFGTTNGQPTSPLSTFFGEKSMKQQDKSAISQPQSIQTAIEQQNALPKFNFAQPSVQPLAAKQDIPQPPFVPTIEPKPSPSHVSAAPPLKSAVATTLDANETTTPLGSPKRPQLSEFKFPSVVQDQPTTSDTSAAPSPSSASASIGTASSKLFNTPAKELHSPPAVSAAAVPDRATLAEVTARVAFTQPQGLFEYFIGHHISKILQDTVKEYQQEVHETIISYVKTRHLARKYFIHWRNRTRRSVLNRRSKQRRKLLAAAMKAESEKQKRNEEELEAIIAATQETKRLQDEARNRREEKSKQKHQILVKAADSADQASHLAGTKRKEPTTATQNRPSARSTNNFEKSHKRSRTIGSFSESSASTRLSSHMSHLLSSSTANKFGQSFFGRSISPQSFRQSITGHKVDSTRTDYFKLKALGIDPDTPLVPNTARTLALRQQRQQEERQLMVSGIRNRFRSNSGASTPVQQPSNMPPPPKLPSASIHSPPARPTSGTSLIANEEDEFLKSLRDARELLSQDEDWFKTATASLQVEYQKQDEFRKSQQLQSNASSRRSSVSGMATVNGYDYYAADTRPGMSLSRTERRIRATGAHGLATKPIDGKAHSPTDQMGQNKSSRRRGSDYRAEHSHARSPGKKRERDDVGQNSPSTTRQYPRTKSVEQTNNIDHTAKRYRVTNSEAQNESPAGTKKMETTPSSFNIFAALENVDSEDEEDELDEAPTSFVNEDENNEADSGSDEEVQDDEEEDDDDDDDDEDNYDSKFQSLPEEELVEDQGSEDESDSGYDPAHGPSAYPRTSNSHTGPPASTFEPGPGASADDALVLSD